MPTIEAMALGRPVIATRGGALSSIVDEGVTGHVVDRGDVDSLAAAMYEILSDSELAQQMGTAGHQRALDRYSWRSYVDRWDDLYERLVS
jgi:glycosyltransferase involved in cell wall biosynthesis